MDAVIELLYGSKLEAQKGKEGYDRGAGWRVYVACIAHPQVLSL